MAAFYWENFIYFGQGPRKGPDGNIVLALPLGGGKLPGIAAEDIGKCAFGIFRRGPEVSGQRFGIAGEVLSGPEYAAAFSRHLGVPVSFYDMMPRGGEHPGLAVVTYPGCPAFEKDDCCGSSSPS